MKENHLNQPQASEILMVLRPRVSDTVNRKTSKFTIDALANMLSYICNACNAFGRLIYYQTFVLPLA